MSLPDRIEAKIRRDPDGCWVWTGATAHGYGKAFTGSKRDGTARIVSTHRLVYQTLVGPIPDGLDLDHLCRNRPCCNPDHLEPVTRAENVRRGRAAEVRRELAARITHCPHGHEYTPENTMVRQTRTGSSRSCRTCSNARSLRDYYENRRAS